MPSLHTNSAVTSLRTLEKSVRNLFQEEVDAFKYSAVAGNEHFGYCWLRLCEIQKGYVGLKIQITDEVN